MSFPCLGLRLPACSMKSWIRCPFRALQVLALSATKAFKRFPMHIGSSCKFLNQALKVLSDPFLLLYIIAIPARRAFFPVPDTISYSLLFHPFPTAQLSPLPLSIPNLWRVDSLGPSSSNNSLTFKVIPTFCVRGLRTDLHVIWLCRARQGCALSQQSVAYWSFS